MHLKMSRAKIYPVINVFNSSRPNAAYMRQKTGSTLVKVMTCRLFGAEPLPEPMLNYC